MFDTITIEVVKGGFIITFPKAEGGELEREVFTSQRKLNHRLKEVIEMLSFVPADEEK